MNNIDILEEKENINLENKYKQTLKMAKEVMEDVSERNNGCEPSKSECLAYNMQYVKKYVESLIAENKELKEENNLFKAKLNIWENLKSDDVILKSKVEEILDKYQYTELGDDYKIIQFYKEMKSLLGKE